MTFISKARRSPAIACESYTDFLPRLRLEVVIFRNTAHNVQSNALVLDRHLDEIVWLKLLGQIVTSLFRDL